MNPPAADPQQTAVDGIVNGMVVQLVEADFASWPQDRVDMLQSMLLGVVKQLRTNAPEASAAAAPCPCTGHSSLDYDEEQAKRWTFFQALKTQLKRLYPAPRRPLTDCRSSGSAAKPAARKGMKASAGKEIVFDERVEVPPESELFDPSVPTFDVDAFLYDDEEVADMDEAGLVPSLYCGKCGCADAINKTQLISHSFSPAQLEHLCVNMLPIVFRDWVHTTDVAATRPVVVDVGSRLGIVTVTVAREADKRLLPALGADVHGVDISKAYVALQRTLLASLPAPTKSSITIDECDIRSEAGLKLISASNFVVLNNVFEWFLPIGEQLAAFEQIRDALAAAKRTSSGPVYVLTYPDFPTTLRPLFKHARRAAGAGRSVGAKSSRDGGAVDDEVAVAADIEAWMSAWLEDIDVPISALEDAVACKDNASNCSDEQDKSLISNMSLYQVKT
jgi:hypothetical protein